jgi:DNA-binding transcriptional MerR regulator
VVKSELLGVHQRTLYQWDKKGLIELEHQEEKDYIMLQNFSKIGK